MNPCDQLAHITCRRKSPRLAEIFKKLDGDSHFQQLDMYELNDLLYREMAWMPSALSMDSEELYQVNIRTIPVARFEDGQLRVLSLDSHTYWPNLNDVQNQHGVLQDMVHAAMVRHVMSWGLRITEPELRMPVYFSLDQLRQNFDAVVVGAGLHTFHDADRRVPRTTNHLTITVVLTITPPLMYQIRDQAKAEIFLCDNKLAPIGNFPELVNNGDESFYDFLRKYSYDSSVMLMPGLE
ncbi:hypothetical protein D3C81_379170 [compost metagenome]